MSNNSQFLLAFQHKNTRVPIWFMRQAGRYLPEYQEIKTKYSLEQMFQTPELAAEITCQPVRILGVDAAILFADILTLPQTMGFEIRFDSKIGPVIDKTADRTHWLKDIHDFHDLPYLNKTIKLINQQLPKKIPLIGFAGSPFTVLCYLIEGGSSVTHSKTFRLMNEAPDFFQKILNRLTDNTVRYLKYQKNVGIKALQLFDTWGGLLSRDDFKRWIVPSISKIFANVDLPSIYYIKSGAHVLDLLKGIPMDVVSVCQNVELKNNIVLKKLNKGVQGNLFNGILYAQEKEIQAATLEVLKAGTGYSTYIFNLSHGVFPDVKVDQLKRIVHTVHEFRLKR